MGAAISTPEAGDDDDELCERRLCGLHVLVLSLVSYKMVNVFTEAGFIITLFYLYGPLYQTIRADALYSGLG